jgi:hypothetical protein
MSLLSLLECYPTQAGVDESSQKGRGLTIDRLGAREGFFSQR